MMTSMPAAHGATSSKLHRTAAALVHQWPTIHDRGAPTRKQARPGSLVPARQGAGAPGVLRPHRVQESPGRPRIRPGRGGYRADKAATLRVTAPGAPIVKPRTAGRAQGSRGGVHGVQLHANAAQVNDRLTLLTATSRRRQKTGPSIQHGSSCRRAYYVAAAANAPNHSPMTHHALERGLASNAAPSARRATPTIMTVRTAGEHGIIAALGEKLRHCICGEAGAKATVVDAHNHAARGVCRGDLFQQVHVNAHQLGAALHSITTASKSVPPPPASLPPQTGGSPMPPATKRAPLARILSRVTGGQPAWGVARLHEREPARAVTNNGVLDAAVPPWRLRGRRTENPQHLQWSPGTGETSTNSPGARRQPLRSLRTMHHAPSASLLVGDNGKVEETGAGAISCRLHLGHHAVGQRATTVHERRSRPVRCQPNP